MSRNPSNRSLMAPMVKLIIFIIITAMATLILANTMRGSGSGGGDEYHAIFSDATQSEPGDEVRIAGVPVGRVTSVELYDNDKARVSFALEGRDNLPANTHAAMKFRNLIGQRYISLSRGEGAAGDTMDPGDTIPLEQTTPAVNLTALFDGFRPLFTTLNPEDVNKLADSLVKVLQGEGGTVQQLVRDIGSLTNTLADRDQIIGEVIDNLTAVLDTINSREQQFDELVINTSSLIDGLSGDSQEIGSALDSLADLTSVTDNVLENTRPAVTDSLTALNTVATDLNGNRDSLESVIETMPVKTEKLVRTGSFGSWFQFYLCGIDVSVGSGSAPNMSSPLLPLVGHLDTHRQPIYTNSAPRCSAEGVAAANAQSNGGGN
ncbi:MAG TPA: MCE family protein [Dietzia timorensis]|uniref:MCE family protein n=1 Tax=Dietzia timorensis TaxID=499555 RepID=A0A921F2V4_9ACTN|nr:MCE family protein [Dietzia timorensis]HJE89499.1 MCE family protein [Dietzia timorensis]